MAREVPLMLAGAGSTGGSKSRKSDLGTTTKGQTAKDLVRKAKHSKRFERM